jgi:molybdopterin-guanine dinucleotide biosynthesis protein
MTKKKPTLVWVSHSGKTTGGGELSLTAIVSIAVEKGYKVYVISARNKRA